MDLIDLMDAPVAPFARGSHTSWKSAKSFTLADRQTKVRRYLRLLAECGGLTDPEVHALTSWPRSSICSIRSIAEAASLVCKTGDTRKSEWDKDCGVYGLTQAGRRQAE